MKSEVEIYIADPGWIDTDPGGGVDRHSTLKGSAKTLEGSPQLGKDPQDLGRIASTWKGSAKTLGGSTLNFERMQVDFGRIASSWKGSTLILGGITLNLKSEVCRFTLADPGLINTDPGGIGGTLKSEVGITLQIRGRSTLTLKSEVEIYLADPGWIDTDLGGGRSTLTLKSEVEIYIADPGWINTDPGGGVDRHSL